MNPALVLVTVSGPDAPGITARLMKTLSVAHVNIQDIGQAVIHGLLSLSFVFELKDSHPSSLTLGPPVIKDLLFQAAELGLRLEFKILEKSLNPKKQAKHHYALTLMAPTVTAQALYEVTQILALFGLNIDRIDRLSENGFSCVELNISALNPLQEEELRKKLFSIAQQVGVDIAIQADGIYRRSKRLVVFDMDSTLIQNEVVDELARIQGVEKEVSKITEQAMQGMLNYDESLKHRVALLKGLTEKNIEKIFSKIVWTPGAQEMVQALRVLGYKTAIISGSFTCIAERLAQEIGIDYAFANTLEIKNGKLTGKVIPPIVNALQKAKLLEKIAQKENIMLEQVIAVGDGANDLLMLEKAGLGIAFNAKPLVRKQAKVAINQKNMSTILYLLGIPARDVAKLLK